MSALLAQVSPLEKTHLSRLLDEVARGNELVIAKAGKPVARLVPVRSGHARKPGFLKGKLRIARDFDGALPDAVLAAFNDDAPERS